MRLREWLKKHEMTQSHFAKAIGVSKSAVTYWLNGKQGPNRNTYKRIKEFTNGAVTQEEVSET